VINCVDTPSRWCHAAADLTFAWHDGTPILDLEDGFDDDLSAVLIRIFNLPILILLTIFPTMILPTMFQSGASVAGVDDDNDDNDNNDNDDDNHDDNFQEGDNEHDFQEEDNEHEAPDEEGPDNNGAPNEDEVHANEEAGDIAKDDMVEAPAFEAVEAPMISDDEDGAQMNDDPVETPGVGDEAEAMEDPLESTGVGTNENPPKSPGVGAQQDVDTIFDEWYGPQSGKYNLRARKLREYSHLHPDLEHTAFTQYNVRQGLKIFGEAGAQQAVVKEMKQLHD
jgi:hypothetical protein